MTSEVELIKIVASRLTQAGIDYMLTGSIAMAVYTTPRMTRDIDIVIQVSSHDVTKIINLFAKDFYIDEISVREAISHRSMFNIIHNESVMKVDFIIKKDESYRQAEFSRRRRIEFEGAAISVVSPEDLILSKLVWAKDSGSEYQLRDVRQLLNTPNNDESYLEEWAAKLTVQELLKKVRDYE